MTFANEPPASRSLLRVVTVPPCTVLVPVPCGRMSLFCTIEVSGHTLFVVPVVSAVNDPASFGVPDVGFRFVPAFRTVVVGAAVAVAKIKLTSRRRALGTAPHTAPSSTQEWGMPSVFA